MKALEKTQENPELLTVEAMQRILDVSRATAYSLIHRPNFPVLWIGRCARIPRQALYKWIEQQTGVKKTIQEFKNERCFQNHKTDTNY